MNAISPNQLFDASKEQMLGGREPSSKDDWAELANFWAYNIEVAEVEICHLMGLLYDCPLTQDELTKIAEFQRAKKANK